MATIAVMAMIVYGSLVPFDSTWSEAFNPQIAFIGWSHPSFTDLFVNIALGVFVGFVLRGALRAGRDRSALGTVLATVAVGCCSAMLAASLELIQALSPTRKSSGNDVVCEALGAGIGALIWVVAGRRVIQWLRDTANERASSALASRLLQLYLPVYLLVRLTPFDTGRAAEIAAKYNEGRDVLRPLARSVDSTFVGLLDLAGNALLAVPIGALAVLGWVRRGTRRAAAWPILIGFSIVVTAGIAQEFVRQRHAAVSQLFVGTLGVVIGVGMAGTLPRSNPSERVGQPRLAQSWFLLPAGVWTLALVARAWYPFNFVVASGILYRRLTQISLVPFGFYYWYATYIVNPLEAVHETLLAFVLAVPLGILLRLSWPVARERRMRRLPNAAAIAVAATVLIGIEAGQAFLPMRFPDVTDALVGVIGAITGVMMATAFASRRFDNPAALAGSASRPPAHDTTSNVHNGSR